MAVSYLVSVFIVLTLISNTKCTPLDDYVHAPDSHYNFRFLVKYKVPGASIHVLNMTSQKWLSEKVSNRPIWWHYVCIVIPDKLDYTDSAFLWIDQGHNTNKIPTATDNFVVLTTSISVTTGTVAATIKQIPNQPIRFTDDPSKSNRSEDDVIAWTWKTFLNNGSNWDILLRLPMTKAVVRGMDTVTSYVEDFIGHNIKKFVIGGASKRGWTTWTTAAVDKRVVGMIPVVMDFLNLRQNLHHHYRSLGGWTYAFKPYYELNFTQKIDSPNMARMQAVIDPLVYNDRYNIPKLIISGSGDEFFLTDDSHYFFSQLQAPKYLKIVPNSDHSQFGHLIKDMLAIQAFYLNILEKEPLLNVTWTRTQTDTGGRISVKMSRAPTQVSVYHARTLDGLRRDFRLLVRDPNSRKVRPYPHPVIWIQGKAKKVTDLEYEAELSRPESGWAAFFIRMTFDGVKNSTLDFTTEVCIVPDVFPFPDCSGKSCKGTLV